MFLQNLKKLFILLFLVVIASGCTLGKKSIENSGQDKSVSSQKEAENTSSSAINLDNEKPIENDRQSKGVIYYYSNEITDPYTSDKYFVRRDKGIDQCVIIGSTVPTAIECALSPYSDNEEIGICGSDRTDYDPSVCELMVKHANGTVDFITDLIRPDNLKEVNSGYKDYYYGNIITGAELIKFDSPNKITMFFGYDFSDTHRGTIATFDLKTKKLSKFIVDRYWLGDYSFFGVTKGDKTLIFMNEYSTDGIQVKGIKENGIYLQIGDMVKKVDFPDVYDLSFVDLKVRENYQNGSLAVMTINDKKYTFDFDKEIFIK